MALQAADIPLSRNRNFVLLYSGKLISMLGDQIYLMALSWYVLTTTHSPLIAAVQLMAGTLPFVVLGPFAGVLADRFERRSLLIAMDMARAALVGAMALFLAVNILSIPLLIAGSFVLGTLGAVFNPSASAIIPNIVPPTQYQRAAALDSFLSGGCNLVGLSAGGVLYATVGIIGVFAINAASYLISGFLELSMRLQKRMLVTAKENGIRDYLRSYAADFRGGFNYLHGQRTILALFACMSISFFILYPQGLIYLPYFFNQVLKASAAEFSIVLGSLFIGIMIGAIAIPRILNDKNSRKILLGGWLTASFANLCLSISSYLAVHSNVSRLWVPVSFFILSIVLGLGLVSREIPVNVVVQKTVEDSYRGRVWAFLGAINTAAMPPAYLLGGVLAAKLPLFIIVFADGVIFLVLTFIVAGLPELKARRAEG